MKLNREIYCKNCKSWWPYYIEEDDLKDKNEIEIECYICKKNIKIKLNSITIYLARTFSVSDSKYKYAVEIKNNFKLFINIIDPYEYEKEIKIGDYDRNYKKIVDLDKHLINNSDVCTFFINNPTFGTISEMFYSQQIGKPIYIYNSNGIYESDVWLKSYSSNGKIYLDCKEMFREILKKYVFEK